MNAATDQSNGELKLDLGCGTAKRAGFLGIDRRKFAGVDGVTDLTSKQWHFNQPTLGNTQLLSVDEGGRKVFVLPDNSVTEIYCSHFLEHLEHNQRSPERVRFMNEIWRVLIPGAIATIITPHWASHRAYGDFTHADKPVSEMFYLYLNKSWRRTNAPDNDAEHHPEGYVCDFDCHLGFTLHEEMQSKPESERIFAVNWYKDAVADLVAKLVTKK